ncbi:hypothetical protein BAN_0076900 [Borrelia anserina BA2]|uniref:ABC transporter substrate-binding protein PnrA-like domain-containing protein n=1 Tax=Borrelia anserina BA2 TaxID=1313293 RepID=W5SMJ5_BORAN|nr:BMP family ABC transporter substrate-binding protein [Borrelia anserina]AHH08354.1 hypothetical protein BAN_0076900 [Borrelia anserina BA2]
MDGMDGMVINSFRYEYESVAKYADKDINLNYQYLGSFVDLSLARTIALRMYGDDTDVIFLSSRPCRSWGY